MKKFWLLATTVWLVGACSPAPQPIEFGTDVCSHCKMTIVDKQHAAELVSDKGKVFKFDAIECMVDYLQENESTTFSLFLVRDFNQPEDWQDARTSHYLISQEVPSPMGAFLSSFKDQQGALELQALKGGEVFDWEQLQQQLK